MNGQTPGEQGIKAAKLDVANANEKSFDSALECYEMRKVAIAEKLRFIESMLLVHEGQFKDPSKSDSKNWGFAGDLEAINEKLRDIMSFIAFDEGGKS